MWLDLPGQDQSERHSERPLVGPRPAAASQRRLNFTGSVPSSSLVFLREGGQPDPTAPGDTHHAGSVLSRVPLVLAAVIAVIDFQNMAQAQRQEPITKTGFS